MPVFHSSKHDAYSKDVNDRITAIRDEYKSGALSKDEARLRSQNADFLSANSSRK